MMARHPDIKSPRCRLCKNVYLTPDETSGLCRWCEQYQFDFSVQCALGMGNDLFYTNKIRRDCELGFITPEERDATLKAYWRDGWEKMEKAEEAKRAREGSILTAEKAKLRLLRYALIVAGIILFTAAAIVSIALRGVL